MWDRRAQFVNNHDGDTLRMILDQGFRDTKEIDIRLLGVFAPELSQPGGFECQEFVEAWCVRNENLGYKWPFVVTTVRMKVADKEQKTLDRFVATVTNVDGTDSLNIAIMQFIMTRGYGGGTGS